MLALLILFFGILSRFIVHTPNFTPVVAIALFGGFYFKRQWAYVVPLVLFAVSDLVIGFHSTMIFTYSSILLIVLIGRLARNNKSAGSILGSGLISAIIFFVITNFGVWVVGGLYPLTLAGLQECFMMAVPFFRYTLASTLIYSCAFFGVYEFAKSKSFAQAGSFILEK